MVFHVKQFRSGWTGSFNLGLNPHMFLVLDLLQRKVYTMCLLFPHSLVVHGQSAKKKKKKKKKKCKTSYVKKWEVFYCMPMEVKEDAQEQSVTVAGLPGWRFFMATFSNLAYFKVVGSKKNHLSFQPKVPTRDFIANQICQIWESWHKKSQPGNPGW